MWHFVGKGIEPIPGIPLQCSDEEFEEAVKAYEELSGPEAAGSVKRSGLYAHVNDEAPAAAPEKE